MTVYDDLSRLLDGELDPAAESELRALISADPELTAAWERLQRLPFDRLLRASPPAELDARVLAAVGPRKARGWMVPWLLLAAAVLALVVRRSPETMVVEPGDALRIDFAGQSEVVFEPGGGDAMTKEMAGTGAALSVVVLQGSATVAAGEPLSAPEPAPVGVPAALQDPRGRALESENALLRKMVADLDAELHGTPIPWPPNLPEELLPAAFERNLRAAVAACVPMVEVVTIDCTEAPCLAALKAPKGADPYGEGRTWYDDLVNDCPAWTDPYTSRVAWASGKVDCPDGTTGRYNVLGWSTHLAADAFPAAEQENRGKRFETRVDEIRETWPCE